MNSKIMKICAIAVVAAFVVTAFAIIPADGSDAADSSKTYYIHFEEVSDTYVTVKSTWIEFKAADGTWASFQAMANVAFVNYGVDEAFNDNGWLTGYGGDCSTWFVKDGKWTGVNDGKTEYISTDTIAITAGPGSYTMAAPPAEVADKYYKVSDTYYQRLPCVAADDFSANGHKTYNVHFDIVNAKTDVDPAQSTWFSFDATDGTQGSFVAGINSAFALYRIELSCNMAGSFSGFGGNITTNVVKDGKWTPVADTSTDYKDADTISIVVGDGAFIWGEEPAAAVKDKYTYSDTMMMYIRNPSVAPDSFDGAKKTYNLVVERIADDATVSSTTKYEFEATDKDNAAFIAAFNVASVKNGEDLTAKITTYVSIKSASLKGSSCWFTTDGKEWTFVDDTTKQYISAEAIALELGPKSYYMDTEPPAEVKDKYWKEPDYNTWHFIPETSSNFYKEEKKSNTMLYVGIGIVAVVVVAGIAFVLLRKK